MFGDIFKKIIEQTEECLIKGIDEIAKTMEEASKPMAERNDQVKVSDPADERRNRSNAVKEKAYFKDSDENIRRGISKFKVEMMRAKPFYGDILMKIPIIEDKSIPTACTNGKCIRYNPNFLRTLNEGQRNYVILHEVYHILLLHWKRGIGRDHEVWNIAADGVVNHSLDRLKHQLPRGMKFERPDKGVFVDQIYWYDYTEELYKKLLSDKKNNKGVLRGNNKKKLHLTMMDLDAPDSLGEEESKICDAQIRELLRNTIKKRGTGDSKFLPSEVLTLVETKKLPWHKLLYDFLQEREDEESSYFTPERKYIHMDLIVPGLGKIDDELGDIWAFVDSSGSINGDEMNQFMTQLYRISKQFNCNFNIAFWDTEVTDIYKDIRHKEDILKCLANHTGGTDINCVYKYIREHRIKPEVMIILTDGYYGTVSEQVGKLKKKTILVISENGAKIEENNEIGRLARL